MFLSFFYILVGICGLYSYQTKKYSNFIISLFFILTSGFGFLPIPGTLSLVDVALFLCLGVPFLKNCRGKNFFSTKNDIIAKIIYLLLGYYTLITFFTVLLDRESFLYSIKIWRLELFYLTYFTFRTIPIRETEKAFNVFIFVTAIAGVLYLLQFIGVMGFLYQNRGQLEFSTEVPGRFNNVPRFVVTLVFYLFFYEGKLQYRNALLILFIAVVIFAQSRGLMLGMLMSIVIYQLLIKQFSKLLRSFFVISLVVLMFYPIIQYRFQSEEGSRQELGFFEEIDQGFLISKNFNNLDRENIQGTFSFRMFLISERLEYLFSNPEYLLTGIGTIHENSPNNRFDFIIGSERIDDSGNSSIQQIDTDDISFATHLFRYGILYFTIFVFFINFSLKRLYLSSKWSVISLAGFLVLLESLIQCLGTDQFSGFALMAFPLLILAQTNSRAKNPI
jgi:hypothetical protein